MERKEFAIIAMSLQASYPRHTVLPSDEAMEVWYRQFEDVPYQVMSTALRKWINTEKWPPSIAEMRSACAEVVNGKLADWGEAWQETAYAIRRYGFMREAEAMQSLSPMARATAQRIGWRALCESENPETIRAQFRQIYETCSKREIEDRQIPAELKSAMENLFAFDKPKQLGAGG